MINIIIINPNDFRYVKETEREDVIMKILQKQGFEIVQYLRKTTSISPLVIWESFFVSIVKMYEKLLENPATASQAMDDIEILESTEAWKSFSTKSLFYEYTQGRNPAVLVNQPIRRSCCMSMDIPGQGACGYCPKTNL
mgnify:FL=1